MSNTLVATPPDARNASMDRGASSEDAGTQFKSGAFSSFTAAVLRVTGAIAPGPEMLHHLFALTAEKDLYSGFAYRVDSEGKILGSMNARIVGETASQEYCGLLKDHNVTILTNSEAGCREGRFHLLDLRSMFGQETWEGRMVFSRNELSPAEVSAIAAKGPVAHGPHDYVGDIYKADARLWPAYSGALAL